MNEWVGEEAWGRISEWVNEWMDKHPQEDRLSTPVIGVQKVQMNHTSQPPRKLSPETSVFTLL